MPKLDPKVLGRCLEIIEESRQRKDGKEPKTPSSDDFRKKQVFVRTDQDERRIELARRKRSLRISSNSYISTGKEIPASLQQRIDAVDAEIASLK